jgi:hypothetical protein
VRFNAVRCGCGSAGAVCSAGALCMVQCAVQRIASPHLLPSTCLAPADSLGCVTRLLLCSRGSWQTLGWLCIACCRALTSPRCRRPRCRRWRGPWNRPPCGIWHQRRRRPSWERPGRRAKAIVRVSTTQQACTASSVPPGNLQGESARMPLSPVSCQAIRPTACLAHLTHSHALDCSGCLLVRRTTVGATPRRGSLRRDGGDPGSLRRLPPRAAASGSPTRGSCRRRQLDLCMLGRSGRGAADYGEDSRLADGGGSRLSTEKVLWLMEKVAGTMEKVAGWLASLRPNDLPNDLPARSV